MGAGPGQIVWPVNQSGNVSGFVILGDIEGWKNAGRDIRRGAKRLGNAIKGGMEAVGNFLATSRPSPPTYNLSRIDRFRQGFKGRFGEVHSHFFGGNSTGVQICESVVPSVVCAAGSPGYTIMGDLGESAASVYWEFSNSGLGAGFDQLNEATNPFMPTMRGIDAFSSAMSDGDMFMAGSSLADVGFSALQFSPLLRGRGKGLCFIAGTPILLCDGTTQYIENIQEGEWVWSRDSDTGEFGCREVVGLEVTPEQPVLALEVSTSDNGSEIFGVTAEHPFRVVGEGWKSAGELKPGDAIFTSTGGWMRVTSSSWQAHTQTVYNFEVADFHTYFVGDGGAWVHNACGRGPTGLRSASTGLRGIFEDGGVRNKSIIEIRSTLKEAGFEHRLADNRSGHLYKNGAEEVRIMRRDGKWDVRVRNGQGNYLDEFGNVGNSSQTHHLEVFSK